MDDEAFLDDEIYDDDSPDHHPVDDDDLGVLGGLARPPDPSVDAPDLQPASCFTPEYLAALAGTDNLEACTFLEMRADTTDEDLSGVGRLMPALAQLRLSNSVLPEMRAFGSAFQRLTVLWIARSEVEDLAGVASLVDLRELYAAFNEVSDVSPLAELDHLQVVDLEGNRVEDPDAPDYLGMCPRLSSLSLEGNPLSRRTYYRRIVCRAIPRLRVLDDRDVDDAIDRMEIPEGLEDEEGPEPNADDANDPNDPNDPNVSVASAAAAALRSLDTSAELAMVTDGIKYAAVGIDDPDAVLTRDEVTGELSVELSDAPLGGDFLPGSFADDAYNREDLGGYYPNQRRGDGFPGSRPGSGYPPPRPGSSRPGSRPGSRPSSRPGSAGAGGGGLSHRPPTASLVRANSLGAALRGALGSAGSSRPGTAAASLSRPGTAASSRSGSGSRPGTAASWGARAASRPSTASRPNSRERPGTARSAGSRPGTAASAEGWASAGFGGGHGEDTSSLFWRKNKQKETRAGLADRGDTAEGGGRADRGASALTTGEGMLVGNPAKLLSRRRRENGAERDDGERRGGGGVKGGDGDGDGNGDGNGDGEATDEDIIAALRRWKIEMAETFSRFNDQNADEDAMEVEFQETRPANLANLEDLADLEPPPRFIPQPPKFTPQPPPGMRPQPPPGMRPQPPGEGGGPRRPNGRVATGGRAARAAAAAAAAKSTGPETGVVLSRQNPKPRAASETSGGGVDRLILED